MATNTVWNLGSLMSVFSTFGLVQNHDSWVSNWYNLRLYLNFGYNSSEYF